MQDTQVVLAIVAMIAAAVLLLLIRHQHSRNGQDGVRQPDGLIEVLLNKTAEYGDRDDAASDLWYSDDIRSERALVRVMVDPTEDVNLKDTCLDSLREIWRRHDGIDPDLRQELVAAELPEQFAREIESTPARREAPPN